MKVRVKLYGMIQDLIPDYDLNEGLLIEMPDAATFGGLFRHLEIPESSGAFAIENGRVMQKTEEISGKFEIRIMQPLSGG